MEGKADLQKPERLEDLEPHMELTGKVSRVEISGAFVDVGLEQEGFIHISLLKRGTINRVEDEIEPGDEVRVWVRRVDPGASRLELTMIRPVSLKWKDINPGQQLRGTIVRVEKFGAFVDIGAERPGLVHVSEMSSGYVSDPKDLVKEGEAIEVTVKSVDRKKRQISLSMKSSQPIEQIEDETPQEAIPTAMEFALRQALENAEVRKQSSREARSGSKTRDDQEEILRRTLQQRLRTST